VNEITLLGIPGGPELFIVLAVVLLLFGSTKLPKLARSLGASVTEFKKGVKSGGDGEGDEPKKVTGPEDDSSGGDSASDSDSKAES